MGRRRVSALAPENTLAAFEPAIAHGLDFAELDVHLSRDGQLMVAHDADLSRVAGREVTAGDLSADELARLDAGGGQGVPRLVEVFELARGRLGLYGELKGEGTGTALGRPIRGGAARGVELIGGSFVPRLVADLRDLAPRNPRSVLFARCTVEWMVRACREMGATYAHPCFRPVDQPTVEALHEAGLLVMTPRTNERSEALEFARIGADVIASDDPRVLAGLEAVPRG